MLKKQKKKNKKKIWLEYKVSKNKKNIVIFHILCTFNNIIITLSDIKGNSLYWATASSVGFKGSKKSTSYAAQSAAEKVGKYAYDKNLKEAKIFIKGGGSGRDNAVRGIFNCGIDILSISDITPTPHNGCRVKKTRRN
ncbi:30S ribosomal protein S11 [Candidatus Nasuia deltocephalinicola]|uniref:30S ribosomal protein S11 n=1 Tax=Candidatus Nasuia deltocephalincola TaxID=1160784 RepID=UPI00216B4EBF|nr:30S ribosomal protein S11 [Candidatus Nasuia deltocephalinicola]